MEKIKGMIADNVRRLRKLKNWTQTDLAIESGVSFPGIQKIEAGKRNPQAETLMALAGALGVTESEILGSEPPSLIAAPLTPQKLAEAIQLSQLTQRESHLLSLFRNASPALQDTIIKTVSKIIQSK